MPKKRRQICQNEQNGKQKEKVKFLYCKKMRK